METFSLAGAAALARRNLGHRPKGQSWRPRRPLRLPRRGQRRPQSGWRNRKRGRGKRPPPRRPASAGPLRPARGRILFTGNSGRCGSRAAGIPARTVELSASADKRLAEYSRRRDAAGASAADHAALARWCRRNRLDEQQRSRSSAHALRRPGRTSKSNNSGLRLRPFLGTLMTPHQIEQAKAEIPARWPRPPTAGGGRLSAGGMGQSAGRRRINRQREGHGRRTPRTGRS